MKKIILLSILMVVLLAGALYGRFSKQEEKPTVAEKQPYAIHLPDFTVDSTLIPCHVPLY